MSGNRERTFIMLKPDAVHRGLVGDIIKRFEQKGFKLVAMKFMHVSICHISFSIFKSTLSVFDAFLKVNYVLFNYYRPMKNY